MASNMPGKSVIWADLTASKSRSMAR